MDFSVLLIMDAIFLNMNSEWDWLELEFGVDCIQIPLQYEKNVAA
jgi:hypothetical protein